MAVHGPFQSRAKQMSKRLIYKSLFKLAHQRSRKLHHKAAVFGAKNFSECEIFAYAFRASFESDLQSKMGKADTVNSVATKCAEKSSSGARKRRSLTFDVEMDITVVTVLTDQSQSVVTGIEVIQNIVSDSLTKTMSAEIVDFEVVSVELEQKVVEQNSVDEVLVEGGFRQPECRKTVLILVDEDDEEATNTISQEQFEILQTQIQVSIKSTNAKTEQTY